MTNLHIAPFVRADAAWANEMLTAAHARGEVLYKPMTVEEFTKRMLGEYCIGLAAREGERPIGFVLAARKPHLLPGENAGSVFVSLLLVERDRRGLGVGTALLSALVDEVRTLGGTRLVISGNNPVHMTWLIPDTPGHDHNNAPGVWEDSPAYAFLQGYGFHDDYHEISMYRALKDYTPAPEREERMRALEREGIRVGRWEACFGEEFDGMCDRVGSEYWRSVLREELAAWRENRPNADPEFWADGRKPAGPRILLTASREGHIVGFTGPVDIQKSGRGWFTGICTDPLWAGHGIASTLFDLLLEEFYKEGAEFCSLFTGVENSAQRIYRRAGLQVVARFCAMSLSISDDEWTPRYF